MRLRKYKLGKIEANGLRRVIAVRAFRDVKKGDVGGYIGSEKNLNHDGLCWIYGNAWVYGDAVVYGEARVYGDAVVSGDARVYANAWVYGVARVYGDAVVCGNARVSGEAVVCGNARVSGDARVSSVTVNVIMRPFSITITDNHVQIGCEILRKTHLMIDGMAAVKRHNLDKKIIARYTKIIKVLLDE